MISGAFKKLAEEMDWLGEVLPGNGNTAYTVKLVQSIGATMASKVSVIVAALGAVLVHALSAFTELFWLLFVLWAADVAMGTIHAIIDDNIEWSASKNLDGVLRLAVYAILGISLAILEQFVYVSTGVVVTGVFLGGGYTICVLYEVKSLVRHWTFLIPGFDGFGRRLLKALQTLTEEDKDGKGTS